MDDRLLIDTGTGRDGNHPAMPCELISPAAAMYGLSYGSADVLQMMSRMIDAEHPERTEALGTAIYTMGQLQNMLGARSRWLPLQLDERLRAQRTQNPSVHPSSQTSQAFAQFATPLNRNAAPFHGSSHQAQQCDQHEGYAAGLMTLPPVPDGAVTTSKSLYTLCTLCRLPIRGGEMVTRLSCRHMFHRSCYDERFDSYISSIEDPTGLEIPCPVCHILGHVISTWRYIPCWSTSDGLTRIEPRDQVSTSTSIAVQTGRTGTRGRGRQCRPPGIASSSGEDHASGSTTDALGIPELDSSVRAIDVLAHRRTNANMSTWLRKVRNEPAFRRIEQSQRNRRQQPDADSRTAPASSPSPQFGLSSVQTDATAAQLRSGQIQVPPGFEQYTLARSAGGAPAIPSKEEKKEHR